MSAGVEKLAPIFERFHIPAAAQANWRRAFKIASVHFSDQEREQPSDYRKTASKFLRTSSVTLHTMALSMTRLAPHDLEELGELVAVKLGADLVRNPIDLLLALQMSMGDIAADLRPPAHRPSNQALRSAVTMFLPLASVAADGEARIRWNKVKGTAPESGSPATEIVVQVIQALRPGIPPTTIFNMIEAVQRASKSTRK